VSSTFPDDVPVIRSRDNDRLRLVRQLGTRRGRTQHARFLFEGPKVLREVLEADETWVEQILYRSGELSSPAAEVLDLAHTAGVPCLPVMGRLFDKASPSKTPQPLLGVGVVRWTPLETLLNEATGPRAVAACLGVQDPGNVGTILRSGRFLGFAGAVMGPGTHDFWSPKVVRSSAGALCGRPVAQSSDVPALLGAARAAGYTPVALVPRGGAVLGETPLPERPLVLLGAEGQGLDPATVADAVPFTIAPAASGAESLNVAVAFAIVAHAWSRQWTVQ
jgi:RNA methyltransferase, TrmH family